jgi:hypothetical protein
MDEVQRTRAWPEELVKLTLAGFNRCPDVVEPTRDPRAHERFYLTAVVIGRSKHLISVAEPSGAQGLPQTLPCLRVYLTSRLVERKRQARSSTS